MRKIMVFQHVGHEPLGTLNPMLKAAGFRIRYINFARHPETVPDLEGYNGLIVLGGPMGVYEAEQIPHLKAEMRAIEQALKKQIPVLGICLGSQLVAHVLGAPVRKGHRMEIGWHALQLTEAGQKDPLFTAYGPAERIFQLHQDTFELPREAKHLARSALFEGQAFSYGDKVYGLQFHLEVDRAMIHRWLHVTANKMMIADSQGEYSAPIIEKETDECIERSLALSQHTFGKFIEMFQLPERAELLGSEHGKPIRRTRR